MAAVKARGSIESSESPAERVNAGIDEVCILGARIVVDYDELGFTG